MLVQVMVECEGRNFQSIHLQLPNKVSLPSLLSNCQSESYKIRTILLELHSSWFVGQSARSSEPRKSGPRLRNSPVEYWGPPWWAWTMRRRTETVERRRLSFSAAKDGPDGE
jgi:hypothetical protein